MAGLEASTPTPLTLTLHQKSRVLEIAFDNGKAFKIPFELMRVYSPSAEVKGHGPGQEVLQLDKHNVQVDTLECIGNYAVKPRFSDGHESGIYSWEYLYWLGEEQTRLWSEYKAKVDKR